MGFIAFCLFSLFVFTVGAVLGSMSYEARALKIANKHSILLLSNRLFKVDEITKDKP